MRSAVISSPVDSARWRSPVGGQDQHLGGDTANVEAGAAEGALLDDRYVKAGQLGRDQRVAGAGTDNDELVMPHRHSLGLTDGRIAT